MKRERESLIVTERECLMERVTDRQKQLRESLEAM